MANNQISVFLLTPSPSTADVFQQELRNDRFQLHQPATSKKPLPGKHFLQEKQRLILVDLREPRGYTPNIVSDLNDHDPGSILIALVSTEDYSTATQALDAGADEILFPDQLGSPAFTQYLRVLLHKHNSQVQDPTAALFPSFIHHIHGMAYRCLNEPRWPMLIVSRGAEDLTGYQPQELYPQGDTTYGDLIHPEDRRTVWNTVQKAVKAGQAFRIQYRLITKENTTKWVQEEGRPTEKNQNGKWVLEGYITDITPRVQAERTSVRSHERYLQLFENNRDAILVADTQRRIIDCNPAFSNLFGYSFDEIQGKKTILIYESRASSKKWGDKSRLPTTGRIFFLSSNTGKRTGKSSPGKPACFS